MSTNFHLGQQIHEAAKNINDLYLLVNEKEAALAAAKIECRRGTLYEAGHGRSKQELADDRRTAELLYKTSKFYLHSRNKQAAQNYGTVVGIDLGTTNASVGIFKNGRAEIIPNDQGNRMTPSYVAFTPDGKRLIGDGAKNQLTSNPENTVFNAKRLIGGAFNDPCVQEDIKRFPFKVIEKNSKPIIQVNIGKDEKLFTPEEILAMILGKMREIAEGYLGKKVTHAVVTVPAYFNDAQRQATKDAGIIAGLNIIRICNEPTAAALYAFGLGQNRHKKNILVFHLGGGTFDVSFLRGDEDVLKVVATSGNTHLGGEDFNQRVMEYFIKLFEEKTGKDVRTDNRAIQKLRHEVEKAKRTLSSQHQTNIEIESFFDNENFSEILTRATFEELNIDLFHFTLKALEYVIEASISLKSSIDEIIIVGGSTRIPKIQELIIDFFHGKQLSIDMDRDEAALYGTALGACLLSNEPNPIDIFLVDINPSGFGIETEGGVVRWIIPPMKTIPSKTSEIFSTAVDNQSTITIEVFEGNRPTARDNYVLGKFEMTGIPPAPQGIPQIEVMFSIDINGILSISSKDIVINRMINDSDGDQKMKERVDAKNQLESYAYSLKIQLNEGKFGEKLSSSDEKKTIESAVEEQIKWLESNQSAEVDELKEHKKQLEEIVKPIITKSYGQSGFNSEPPSFSHKQNDDDL